MQVAGFVGMTIGMLILLTPQLAAGGAAAHVPIVFIGFILFNLAMNAGPNATTFGLAPELFTTGIRASAGGFAAAFCQARSDARHFHIAAREGARRRRGSTDDDGRRQRSRGACDGRPGA